MWDFDEVLNHIREKRGPEQRHLWTYADAKTLRLSHEEETFYDNAKTTLFAALKAQSTPSKVVNQHVFDCDFGPEDAKGNIAAGIYFAEMPPSAYKSGNSSEEIVLFVSFPDFYTPPSPQNRFNLVPILLRQAINCAGVNYLLLNFLYRPVSATTFWKFQLGPKVQLNRKELFEFVKTFYSPTPVYTKTQSFPPCLETLLPLYNGQITLNIKNRERKRLRAKFREDSQREWRRTHHIKFADLEDGAPYVPPEHGEKRSLDVDSGDMREGPSEQDRKQVEDEDGEAEAEDAQDEDVQDEDAHASSQPMKVQPPAKAVPRILDKAKKTTRAIQAIKEAQSRSPQKQDMTPAKRPARSTPPQSKAPPAKKLRVEQESQTRTPTRSRSNSLPVPVPLLASPVLPAPASIPAPAPARTPRPTPTLAPAPTPSPSLTPIQCPGSPEPAVEVEAVEAKAMELEEQVRDLEPNLGPDAEVARLEIDPAPCLHAEEVVPPAISAVPQNHNFSFVPPKLVPFPPLSSILLSPVPGPAVVASPQQLTQQAAQVDDVWRLLQPRLNHFLRTAAAFATLPRPEHEMRDLVSRLMAQNYIADVGFGGLIQKERRDLEAMIEQGNLSMRAELAPLIEQVVQARLVSIRNETKDDEDGRARDREELESLRRQIADLERGRAIDRKQFDEFQKSQTNQIEETKLLIGDKGKVFFSQLANVQEKSNLRHDASNARHEQHAANIRTLFENQALMGAASQKTSDVFQERLAQLSTAVEQLNAAFNTCDAQIKAIDVRTRDWDAGTWDWHTRLSNHPDAYHAAPIVTDTDAVNAVNDVLVD